MTGSSRLQLKTRLGFFGAEKETLSNQLQKRSVIMQIKNLLNSRSLAPGSLFTPTPLRHKENVEVGQPSWAYALQWCPTRFNFPSPEVRGAAIGVLPEFVQNTATDFAQLKVALTKTFSVVRNRKDLEIQFYSSQQCRNEEPTDFIYNLLKVHKKLRLRVSEEALVDHIFGRLEPRVQDYVEVMNSQTTTQLLELMAKFESRYSCKKMQGSRNSDNFGR
ncbi:uncharacterized protein TNCV_5126461 [Trichonephila clavipes]|nr:uncharacterized protein TNCV_5126461 [Trichonephila clavipes]